MRVHKGYRKTGDGKGKKIKISFRLPSYYFKLLVALLLLSGSSLLLYGWPWSIDMVVQPTLLAHERPMPPPEGTLPIAGAERPLTESEAEAMPNPVEPTPESLARGKLLFETYCQVCHGAGGKGDGPVGKKWLFPPDITAPSVVEHGDGRYYSVISYGGMTMPQYSEMLSSRDRWAVIRYIRKLQGK